MQADKTYLPLISIIVPTLNNENEIEYFLKTIQKQVYPKNKIETIVVDGGSKDKTLGIIRKHAVKIIDNPQVLAEPGISIGMQKAKGDLKMVLASDNIFTDKCAFKKIAEVFDNKNVYAALPKQNYTRSDNLFTKYHNTFTDPFNHFVHGDASNARTFNRVYRTVTHNKLYDIYDFNSNPIIPMISFSQGFTIRGSYRRKKMDIFDDNSPVIDLIKNGKQIAYIHSLSIYHHTIKNIHHFIKKQRWATQNALERKNYGIAHRFDSLSKGQKLMIALWPFYALSLIFPTMYAFYGFIKDKEAIWLFHPINCLICLYANCIQSIVFFAEKLGLKTKKISRQ